MKKTLLVMGCFGFLITIGLMGCGGDPEMTPEEFGKYYMSEKFKGAIVDLDDLDYTVIDEDEDNAWVKIEGDIEYEETISLEKQGKKWVLATSAVKPEPAPAQTVKAPEPAEKAPEPKAQH